MRVDQASYRAWDGAIQPGRGVSFAIAGTMIRKMRRSRWISTFIIGFPVLTCLIAVVVFAFWYMYADAVPRVFRFPGANLLAIWNRGVQQSIGFFTLILAALVGGPLIAEDRRARALPLYFSRPVSHLQYVLGKLYTLFFFLGIVFLGPPLLTYLVEISLSPEKGVVTAQLPTLWNSLVPNLARLVSLSVVVLAISSLTQRATHAALTFFGILIVVQGFAFICARQVFHDPNWLALSPKACIDRIVEDHLPMPRDGARAFRLAVGGAWIGITAWTVVGVAVLFARIRKVEVVS